MPHQTGDRLFQCLEFRSNVRFDLLIFKLVSWSFGGWGTVGSYSICLFMDSGWPWPQGTLHVFLAEDSLIDVGRSADNSKI